MSETLIFEKSRSGRRARAQAPAEAANVSIPAYFLRDDIPLMPEVSEMQVVRHYTRLSQQNFSIDTQFYPLGSCTMKYNPRACNTVALLPGCEGDGDFFGLGTSAFDQQFQADLVAQRVQLGRPAPDIAVQREETRHRVAHPGHLI